jgi:hypothetical protein
MLILVRGANVLDPSWVPVPASTVEGSQSTKAFLLFPGKYAVLDVA